MVKCRHAIIVKFGGDGAENGHFRGIAVKCFAVSLYLLADIPDGVISPAFLKLVDHYQIGKVQHVDFFKL